MKPLYFYTQAFLDGCYMGADILGFAIGKLGGDIRNIGFQADRAGLSGNEMRKGLHYKISRDLGEQTMKAIGDVAGLAVNVGTLFLINVMHLGEVYCKEERFSERVSRTLS